MTDKMKQIVESAKAGALHPLHVHVHPTGKNEFTIHSVGSKVHKSIKHGMKVKSSDLDDFRELGMKVKETKKPISEGLEGKVDRWDGKKAKVYIPTKDETDEGTGKKKKKVAEEETLHESDGDKPEHYPAHRILTTLGFKHTHSEPGVEGSGGGKVHHYEHKEGVSQQDYHKAFVHHGYEHEHYNGSHTHVNFNHDNVVEGQAKSRHKSHKIHHAQQGHVDSWGDLEWGAHE